MIIYIYNKNNLEEIPSEPIAPSLEDFQNEPVSFFPAWNQSVHIASDTFYTNPILDSNNNLREKTREEQILLDNKIELLADGEYIENKKIIVVPAPEGLFIKKWNKEAKIWEEGATNEDINKEIDRLIDIYIDLAEKKDKYSKYGFSTLELEHLIAENILKREELVNKLKQK